MIMIDYDDHHQNHTSSTKYKIKYEIHNRTMQNF